MEFVRDFVSGAWSRGTVCGAGGGDVKRAASQSIVVYLTVPEYPNDDTLWFTFEGSEGLLPQPPRYFRRSCNVRV